MGCAIIPNVRIKAIASVAADCIELNDFEKNDKKEQDKFNDIIGIHARRIADSNTTTVDLMFKAASKLLSESDTNIDSIGCILCVSQTPNHLVPGNSYILCDRLHASRSVLSLDISAGCSGFTHGLLALGRLLDKSSISRGLLVAGDTLTKYIDKNRSAERSVFGDAASACLVEYDSDSSGFVAMWKTVADKYSKIIVPGSLDSLIYGAGSSDTSLLLDGSEVFSFSIKEVPEMVNSILDYCEMSADDIGLFVFHQANKFMVHYIAKKLHIPDDKAPVLIDGIGNTSSASIPVVLSRYAASKNIARLSGRMCLVGYGVGLSISAIMVDMADVNIAHVDI